MRARVTDQKTRKLLQAGWLATLLILVWALFSPWGIIRYHRLSNDLEQLAAANLELQENNLRLKEEINNLTNNPAYIESVAREQHGLLKSNELVYVFPSKKKSKQ